MMNYICIGLLIYIVVGLLFMNDLRVKHNRPNVYIHP